MTTHLFSSDLVPRLAATQTAVVLDFDGTLAPIVFDRDKAEMSSTTRALLARVVAHYPCAVLSGRSRADVGKRLGGTGVEWIVGSHGADWGWPSPDEELLAERVSSWRPRLDALLEKVPGVSIEDKRFSLSIHYRESRYPAETAAVVLVAARTLERARILEGKRVVSVVPDLAPHKGVALAALRALLGCEWLLYVGDDTTDEDVFAMDDEFLVKVRVEHSATSRARYHLNEQVEIDQLLRMLADERQTSPIEMAPTTRVSGHGRIC